MGLAIEVKIGEQITVGDNIVITVYEQPRPNRIRLHFDAPKEVIIKRVRKDSNDKR